MKKIIPKYLETRYTDENGCILCKNVHNHDGYVRVRCTDEKRLKMLHVIEWERVNGKRPEGTELNHLCNNRGCCNLDHLELIDGSEHATLTNVNRVGYTQAYWTDEEVAMMYRLVKYKGVFINQLVRELGIKRSTLSSIMNKRSRCSVTDKVDSEYINIS